MYITYIIHMMLVIYSIYDMVYDVEYTPIIIMRDLRT